MRILPVQNRVTFTYHKRENEGTRTESSLIRNEEALKRFQEAQAALYLQWDELIVKPQKFQKGDENNEQ